MKTSLRSTLLILLAGSSAILFSSCASAPKKPATAPAVVGVGKTEKIDGKMVKVPDDLDEYDIVVSDPLMPVNRVTFWFNHQLYRFVFRPVSKTYKFIIPKPVRNGIYNVFDNVEFPIRFVNHTLQGDFKNAGLETGRFLVNSTVGVGGIGRPADHMPAFADIPRADTGQTLAKWGIGNGPYIVIPILGPSTARDVVGLAGDYALNPISWISFVYGGYTWLVAIPATDTVSSVPNKLDQYDAATKDNLDMYLAARTAYIQYRNEVAKKGKSLPPPPPLTPPSAPKGKITVQKPPAT